MKYHASAGSMPFCVPSSKTASTDAASQYKYKYQVVLHVDLSCESGLWDGLCVWVGDLDVHVVASTSTLY